MTDTEVMNKPDNKTSQEDTLRQVLEILQQLPNISNSQPISQKAATSRMR